MNHIGDLSFRANIRISATLDIKAGPRWGG